MSTPPQGTSTPDAPAKSPSFPFPCLEPGCDTLLVFSNRHGWLHTTAPETATVAEARAAATLEDDDTSGHQPGRFRALGPKPPVDTRPSVLMHAGCATPHTRIGDIRRCAGRFVTSLDYWRVHLDV